MTTFDRLIERLDLAQPDQWEHEYSLNHVDVSRDQAYDIFISDRVYAEWFGFRFDAGPPGTTLPSFEDAIQRIITGPGCDALDAFCVHFNPPRPFPHDLEPEFYIAVLVNSTMGALSNGPTWFAGWLAYRAALAALILGQPEHTWRIIDLFTHEGIRHSHIERLSILDPIREHPLEHHPLIQATFCHLWFRLDVPFLPYLPPPDLNDDDPNQIIDELEALGAHELRRLVGNFIHTIIGQGASRYDDEPLIQQLRQCVLNGEINPPHVETLPEWFVDWARSVGRDQQWELMRLVGLLLFEHGAAEANMIFVLIAPTSRAQDLETMSHFTQASELVDELQNACVNLPTHIADALLAMCWPRHQHALNAFEVVAEHMEMIEALELPEEGIILHTLRGMRRYLADVDGQAAYAATIMNAIRETARQLPERLNETSLTAAISSLEPVGFNHNLIVALMRIEANDVQALVRALFIRAQLANTELERAWSPRMARDASDAIRDGQYIQLNTMRLRLLDEAIDTASPDLSQLYYQRAHVRQFLAREDDQQMELVEVDLRMARGLALQENQPSVFARTITSLVRHYVAANAQYGAGEPFVLNELHEDIRRALRLPLQPHDHAPLLQALAHLMRLQNDPAVFAIFEGAIEQARLIPDSSLWVELTAEMFDLMTRMALYDEVISQGELVIETIPANTEPADQAMLLLTYACALMNRNRLEESRRHTQASLELVRGQDPHLEAHCRLQLGRIDVMSNDINSAIRQHRLLQDEQHSRLHAPMRMDILLLEIMILGAQSDLTTQRQRYIEARASAQHEGERARFDLEIALLDIRLGHGLEDPDGIILRGLDQPYQAQSEQTLIELLFNHHITYEPSTLRVALEWARQTDRVNVIARLEQSLGEDGAQTLRTALAGELNDFQRMGCVHELLLMTDDQQERPGLYTELERLLAIIPNSNVRVDLASIMQLHAERDWLTLERARAHIDNALADELPHRLRALAQRTLGQITYDGIISRSPRSAPDVAQRAQWLTEELLLSANEQADLKYAIAHGLLIMGPLTHPEVVEVASQIISNITHEELPVLRQKIAWIEGYISGQTLPRPVNNLTEMDNWPDEVIWLIQGHQAQLTPSIYHQIQSRLHLIAQTRPDTIDRLLGAVIDIHELLPDESLATVHCLISLVSDEHQTWTEVQHAIERTESNHPTLRNIQNIAQFMASRYDNTQSTPPSEPLGDAQNSMQDDHDRAQHLMDLVRMDPHGPEALERIHEARALLRDISDPVRGGRFMNLVCYANALKLDPEPQLELALDIYERAHDISQGEPLANQATLWKVHADGLLMRGRADDIRRAARLAENACNARNGLFLAEALLSWSRVMKHHPDHTEAQRNYEAARLIMKCVQTWPEFAQQPSIQHYIQRCMNDAATDHAEQVNQWRETLGTIYPSFGATVPFSTEELNQIIPALEHPEFMQYSEVRFRLMSSQETPTERFVGQLGPAQIERLQTHLQEQSLLGRPAQALELLNELEQRTNRGPGILAACALLRVHLIRTGTSDDVNAARAALFDAEHAVEQLQDTVARLMLTHELAMLWSPGDDSDDPICDFSHAVDLLTQCVELSGSETRASVDVIGSLARAYRYSDAGDLHNNRQQAHSLYLRCLDKDLTIDVRANLLMNIAELEVHMASGDRLQRIRSAISRLEEALSLDPSDTIRNEVLANLAWDQTQLALWSPEDQRVALLEQSLTSFEQVDMTLLDEWRRHNVRGNQMVSLTSLERIRRGGRTEIPIWRSYVTELQSENLPYRAAMAQHNLAHALFFSGEVTYMELFEGLMLTNQALHMRTRQANPRHHWETTLNAARALLNMLHSTPHGLPGMTRNEVIDRTLHYLSEATTSARMLGLGEELMVTAFMHCQCALLTPRTLANEAERAWRGIQDSTAYMLLNPTAREQEAWLALTIAGSLATHISGQANEFILSDEDAQLVTRWLIRAQLPTRRLSRARLARPEQASISAWSTWQHALSSGDQPTILNALQNLREEAPEFLMEEAINYATWQWLERMPTDSVAMSLFMNTRTSLALVLRLDDGQRRVDIMGLDLDEMPEEQGARAEHHDQLVSWLQRGLVAPLEEFLPTPPPALLWNPGPGLRVIAPGAIWPDREVAVTTSFVLPTLSARPGRRNSTLLALADPGPKNPALDLKGQGLPTLNTLAEVASASGQIKIMASVGEAFGHTLLGDDSHVINAPTNTQCLLDEASEHAVVVLIAHGEIQNIDDAALLCVNERGEIEHLDVLALTQAPQSFAGADVILLSCDGGQVGDHLATPSGLAGTLILAGATSVTAPLWPVRLDHAQAVGGAIIEGIARGLSPWSALLGARAEHSSSSVLLGAPAPPAARRQQASAHDQMAFVCWVG